MDANSEHCVYHSPKIEVAAVEGKGRGYVAKELIPRGEVLLTEHPFAVAKATNVPQLVKKVLHSKVPLCHAKEFKIRRSKLDGVTDEEYSRTWSQVVSNGFRSEMLGQLLFLLFKNISSFNHSCLPNAAVLEKDNLETAVLTIREIHPGEEICISYRAKNFLEWPCEKRRKWLRSNFFFHCCCERCSSEGELGPALNVPSILSSELELMRAEWKRAKKVHAQCTELRARGGNGNLAEISQETADLYENFLDAYQTKLGNDIFHRWRLIAARSHVIDLYIIREDYPRALVHLIHLLAAESKSYQHMRYHIARITSWNLYHKVKLHVRDRGDRIEDSGIRPELSSEVDPANFEIIIAMIKSAY